MHSLSSLGKHETEWGAKSVTASSREGKRCAELGLGTVGSAREPRVIDLGSGSFLGEGNDDARLVGGGREDPQHGIAGVERGGRRHVDLDASCRSPREGLRVTIGHALDLETFELPIQHHPLQLVGGAGASSPDRTIHTHDLSHRDDDGEGSGALTGARDQSEDEGAAETRPHHQRKISIRHAVSLPAWGYYPRKKLFYRTI